MSNKLTSETSLSDNAIVETSDTTSLETENVETSDTANQESENVETSETTSQESENAETSDTIHSWDSFSTTSHETRFNTFENDGFITFSNVQDDDVGTEDSYSLISLESNESNLSGNFIVYSENEEGKTYE